MTADSLPAGRPMGRGSSSSANRPSAEPCPLRERVADLLPAPTHEMGAPLHGVSWPSRGLTSVENQWRTPARLASARSSPGSSADSPGSTRRRGAGLGRDLMRGPAPSAADRGRIGKRAGGRPRHRIGRLDDEGQPENRWLWRARYNGVASNPAGVAGRADVQPGAVSGPVDRQRRRARRSRRCGGACRGPVVRCRRFRRRTPPRRAARPR